MTLVKDLTCVKEIETALRERETMAQLIVFGGCDELMALLSCGAADRFSDL